MNGSVKESDSAENMQTLAKGAKVAKGSEEYLGMHNDVSFLISNEMNPYEQQSTYNPNMPVRLLQYAGNLYEKYFKDNSLYKYGGRLLQLPVPLLVVFYNGKKEQPDEMILKLSDSFPEGSDADIEVKVRMLNVNVGRNRLLLEACKPLGEYSWLVDEIRKNNTTKDEDSMSSAVDRAISDMPDSFVIKSFLELHRTEVKGMLLTEYNEAEASAEGIIDTLISLVQNGLLSIKDAAAQLGITEVAFQQKMLGK